MVIVLVIYFLYLYFFEIPDFRETVVRYIVVTVRPLQKCPFLPDFCVRLNILHAVEL